MCQIEIRSEHSACALSQIIGLERKADRRSTEMFSQTVEFKAMLVQAIEGNIPQ